MSGPLDKLRDSVTLAVLLREARASVVFQLNHVNLHYSHDEKRRRAAPLEKLLADIDKALPPPAADGVHDGP